MRKKILILTVLICTIFAENIYSAIDYDAFFNAAALGAVNEVMEYIDAGANVDARNKAGKTALMHAASNNDNPEVVMALIEAGAKVAAKDNAGKTAFDYIKENDALKDTEAFWVLENYYWYYS